MKLFLCEKPSQGKDIAAVLGPSQRHQGYLTGKDFIVTWAIGHLLESAAPETYGEQFTGPWRVQQLPIVPNKWQMNIKKDTADQFNVVSRLIKQADYIVIATDADREGEVIARELLDYCQYRGSTERLWLSSLDEESIRKALAHLLPGSTTEKLYYAGIARARADWLTGMNLTRLYTLKAKESGYEEVLSIGRVQTPTLTMVVNRDRLIADFQPLQYWKLQVVLEHEQIRFTANWFPAKEYCDSEMRCNQLKIAKAVLKLSKEAVSANVLEVVSERNKVSAPLAFDLGTLQLACSRKWGMGAGQVLKIAQSLYETHKATTYPRSDCGYLPFSMFKEIKQVFSALLHSDPSIENVLNTLDRNYVSRIWDDEKITAHHGIVPTKQPCVITKLTLEELKVYQLIRQHYLAQFLPINEIDVTSVKFEIAGQLFQTSGKVVVIEGWKVLFVTDSKEDKGDNNALPLFQPQSSCAVIDAAIKPLKTKPPHHFTDGTLIEAMKNAAAMIDDPQLKKILKAKAGLGTEATRAAILDTLFKRRYLEKKGKYLHSTLIANELIASLPEALTNPGMTAIWEQALDDIASGEMELDHFMARQSTWITHLVEQGKTQTILLTLPAIRSCPKCSGKMKIRFNPKDSTKFWGCINYPTCAGLIGMKIKKKAANKI